MNFKGIKRYRLLAALLSVMLLLLPLSGMAGAAQSVSASIPVEKLVQGDLPTTAETFTFTLTPKDNANPMPPAGNTITIAGTGTGSFASISFPRPGYYEYQVTETTGSATGYDYDDTVYDVMVFVSNATSGGLTYSLIVRKDGIKTDGIKFTNTYARPVQPPVNTGTLTVSKTVTGGMGELTKPFTFTVSLYGTDGVTPLTGTFPYSGVGVPGGTLSHGDTVTLTSGQSIVLRDLPVGTRYTVVETEADQDGYTTSAQGASGSIVATGNTSAFLNHKPGMADPDPIDVTLSAQKTMDGTPATGSAFTFLLKDESGHVLQRVSNVGAFVTFLPLHITEAGVYHYTLAELAGGGNVLYDSTAHPVTVTVTQSGLTLQAAVTYDDNAVDPPTFVNTTKPGGNPGDGGETKQHITITKVWEDNADEAGKRPDRVTITLLRNDTAYQTVTLSAAKGWQESVAVPEKGTYRVEEDEISGYTSIVSGSATDGFVVTNRYTEEIEPPVEPIDPPTPPNGEEPGTEIDPNTPGGNGDGINGDGGEAGGSSSVGSTDGVPQTGDGFRIGLWALLFVLSGFGVVALLRNKSEKQ